MREWQSTYSHQVVNVVHKRRLPEIDEDVLARLFQANRRVQLASDDVVERDAWQIRQPKITKVSLAGAMAYYLA